MMKKISLITGIFFAAAGAFFFSCKKDLGLKDGTTSPAGTALIRIIDISPNFRNIWQQPDSFNVLFNGVRVTAYTPGTALVMTYNSTYPFAGTNSPYVSVAAGSQSIKLALGVNKLDSVVIATFNKTLVADQHYSFLITDSLGNSTRDSSQIFVRDSITTQTIGYFNLRFIHAVFNDTAGKAIDVWSTRNNRNIFTNVKPGTVSGFAQYAYNAALSDTLFVRRAGTTFGLDTLSAVSFFNQRAYTLVYKGDGNINANSNIKRRHLAYYINQ
jgi:hypothetical protein